MMEKGRDNKPHIGIYGRRNSGKSSLINRLVGQDVAIVSSHRGTTADPVRKSYEIIGVGAVILIDTAGIDDSGELGKKRVEKTLKSIETIDLAIIVIAGSDWGKNETDLICRFKEVSVPYILVYNKSDLGAPPEKLLKKVAKATSQEVLSFSTLTSAGLNSLIKMIGASIPNNAYSTTTLLGDIIKRGDIVMLITPIDSEAPEGRLILPQVQAIRDIIDNDAIAIILKEEEVDLFLERCNIKPALAITDSQIFAKADASVPDDIPLTSFSIALARMKGDFENYLAGTPKISELMDGDRILLLESCSHQVSCDDIGRFKIPGWISNFTGKKIRFDIVSGLDSLSDPITDYAMVIQCGACMITRKQLSTRLRAAIKAGVPVSNYGLAIAWVQGTYNRAIAPFTRL